MRFRLELEIQEDWRFRGEAVWAGVPGRVTAFVNPGMACRALRGTLLRESPGELFAPGCRMTLLELEACGGTLALAYSGTLRPPLCPNQVLLPDHAELALYSGAYPVLLDLPMLEVEASLTLRLPELHPLGFEREGDAYRYRARSPDVPLLLCRRDILCAQSANASVYSYMPQPKEAVREMLARMQAIYDVYARRFGPCGVKRAAAVLNPRAEGGAYVRGGLLCLESAVEGLEPESFVHLAHEIAHFWWHNGKLDVHNDWLNEGFAQYSALLAAGEVLGEAVPAAYLARYGAAARGLPSISGLTQNDGHATRRAVHYEKGAYILHRFGQKLGAGAMAQWLRVVCEKKPETVWALLGTLAPAQRAVLEQLLKQ